MVLACHLIADIFLPPDTTTAWHSQLDPLLGTGTCSAPAASWGPVLMTLSSHVKTEWENRGYTAVESHQKGVSSLPTDRCLKSGCAGKHLTDCTCFQLPVGCPFTVLTWWNNYMPRIPKDSHPAHTAVPSPRKKMAVFTKGSTTHSNYYLSIRDLLFLCYTGSYITIRSECVVFVSSVFCVM